MSQRGVIVALLVCIILAVAALFLTLSPAPPSAPAGPLLDFAPADLTQIRLTRPGKPTETARRLPGGSWIITLGDKDPWPASGERIRPALRILSTLTPLRPAEKGASIGPDATEATLTHESGQTITLRIAPRPLAGAVLIETTSGETKRTAWVDAAISDMLAGTGLAEWRQTTALPDLADVSRITLQGSKGTIALARIQGRWGLTQPESLPAEPDAVARLFSLLGQVQVADFLDAGSPADSGIQTPTATLILETDLRDADDPASLRTIRRALDIGTTADVGGRTVYARLSESIITRDQTTPAFQRTIILTGQPLADIRTDPESYIARRAVSIPAAEIGQIRLPGATFTRTIDGWRRGEAPATSADAAAIASLLDLLTSSKADTVLLAPPDFQPIQTVELLTQAGDPLASVRIGLAGEGLAIGQEPVWRLYRATPAHQSLIPWLGNP